MSTIKFLKVKGTWREVADAARTTIRQDEGTKEPSSRWKKRILLAEHSPIRKLTFNWKWLDLPYWVSVHFVRHKFGIEHFVSTQRTDRTGVVRDESRQDATTPVIPLTAINCSSSAATVPVPQSGAMISKQARSQTTALDKIHCPSTTKNSFALAPTVTVTMRYGASTM